MMFKFKYRAVSLMLIILMLLPVAVSCESSPENKKDSEPSITVVATIFPQYDFARSVLGDIGEVKMLLAPRSESHTYEPSMADIAEISKADLFIYTGGGIDPWAENIKESLGGAETETLAISDLVEDLCEADHGHEHDSDGETDPDAGGIKEHIHTKTCTVDEHVWTSPKNALDIFDGILEKICETDPENESSYRKNAESYRNELVLLDIDFENAVAASEKKDVVFADRFPFVYLMNDYGINYHAALSGCSVGDEPSAAKIAELIETVNNEDIKYVFIIENSTSNTAKLISEATGCGILLMHSCHNVSEEELSSDETYCSLMRKNLENLKKALN